MAEKIFGYDWEQIQAKQNRGVISHPIDVSRPGDYGADPIGDGTFRMVPSGDVVSWDERQFRLSKATA